MNSIKVDSAVAGALGDGVMDLDIGGDQDAGVVRGVDVGVGLKLESVIDGPFWVVKMIRPSLLCRDWVSAFPPGAIVGCVRSLGQHRSQ